MIKARFKVFFLLILLGIGYVGFLQFNIMKKFNVEPLDNAKYLIVLGTRVNCDEPSLLLQKRIDAAANYLKDNKNTIAIASGGQGLNECITEAKAIKEGLNKQGIESNRILLEDKSSRTVENIAFSKEHIQNPDDTIVVVSNAFHLYRSVLIGKDQGLKLHPLPSDTPTKSTIKWYSREYLSITKYYIERLGL